MAKFFLWLVMIIFWSASCGRINEAPIKQYSLHFYSQNTQMLKAAKGFVEKFNRDAGITVLSFSETEDGANSYASFIPNLLSQQGAVAYGRAVKNGPPENPLSRIRFTDKKRTVRYAMRLEFDLDYFKTNAAQPEGSLGRRSLYTLFCHEIGHGLTLKDVYDSKQRRDIMYGTIESQDVLFKDYKTFFARVRAFIGGSS